MKQDLKNQLYSITPIDGRYKEKVQELSIYLSEFALIKYRLEIEVRYLLFLSAYKIIRKLNKSEINQLEKTFKDFSLNDAIKIKKIENKTKHDIKAIENFLIQVFKNTSLNDIREFIHIGLTSEDVNNIAYRLMIKNTISDIFLINLTKANGLLRDISKNNNFAMLARTHGQPAVPTTFGKEIYIFFKRLEKELNLLNKIKLTGKLNGAVGNYNALSFVYPKFNWLKFSRSFIISNNLTPNLITTQINPFEDIIILLQNLQRINGILIDLNQDLWRYISDDWLKLAVKKDEVGSSTMPQKINPIDFENSEGNLILANGLMQTIIDKLYISRLQRDLSNSTVVRNIATAMGFSLIGYKSLLNGLVKTEVNKITIYNDLNKDWSILSEGLQIYLRSKKYHNAYNSVLKLTRGRKFNKKSWKNLISSLKIPESDKQKLLSLTPENYLGLSKKLVYI